VDNYKIHNINNISHNYDNFKVFNKEGKALIMLGEKKSRKRIALLTMLMMLISIYVPSAVWADEAQTEEYEYNYKGYDVVDWDSYKASYPGGSSAIAVFKLSKNGTGATEYAYCSDINTPTEEKKQVWYSRTNIENSGYFPVSNARKIRNIVVHSYPFISIDEVAGNINEWITTYNNNNDPDISLSGGLNEKTLKTATQIAIWRNSNSDKAYINPFNIPTQDQNNVDVVLKYLMSLPDKSPDSDEIVVEDVDISANIDTVIEAGIKTHDLTGTFHFYDKEEGDVSIGTRQLATPDPEEITLTLEVGEKRITGTLQDMMAPENDMGIFVELRSDMSYGFEIKDIDDKYFDADNRTVDIIASFNGQQQMPAGAYFYKTENRNYSQNFVGYSAPWSKPIDISAMTTVGLDPTVALEAEKLMDHEVPGTANIFEFELKNEAGEIIQTKSNDASGNIVFDEISFKKEKATYKYTISEKIPEKDIRQDVMYDETICEVTVDVAFDENEDAYVATPTFTVSGEEAAPVFNNYTIAPAELTLTAEKLFDGEVPAAGYEGQFVFKLMDENGDIVREATNGKDGMVTFDKMSFNKAGTYRYTLYEEPGTDKNIIYDGTTYIVEVDVALMYGVQTLDLDSEPQGPCYVATATITNSAAMISDDDNDESTTAIFYNKSVQPAKGRFMAFRATKPGVASPDKEIDTFVLKDADGNQLQEKQNDGNGNVEFDEVEFPKREGIYKYTIVKNPWDENNVVYDEATYTAIVKVIYKEAKEKYDAEVTYFDGDIKPEEASEKEAKDIPSFEDLRIAPAKVRFEAIKTLDGKEPGKKNTYEFQLKDAEGNVISKAKNDADGKILFDEISYDAIGEHTYTVSEVMGTDEDIIYDNTIYSIDVKVTLDEENNKYVADMECLADEILFANETADENAAADLDDATDTGDHSCMILWLMIVLTSLAVMILILMMHKRETYKQA